MAGRRILPVQRQPHLNIEPASAGTFRAQGAWGLPYEASGLSARLSWQYRSEWIDGIGDGDIMGDEWWSEVGRLDFSLRYAFNDNVEMYFDANNLLDESGIRYQGIQRRTTEYERFGKRFMIGVRMNF